jgi:2-polyprenyl-3-methyl-5-hydroxy-6-metoxy-1,4-benzoquinol methylase
VASLDDLLARWRTALAFKEIPADSRVLDVGCGGGLLLRRAAEKGMIGFGIDRTAPAQVVPQVTFFEGSFPSDLPEGFGDFDAITALAVLEHIPAEELPIFLSALRQCLAPDGRIILTVPSHHVDAVLHFLIAMRVLDGMSHEEHHGFRVQEVVPMFESAGFRLVRHRRFQLGLNNLFVFTAGSRS